MDKSKKRILIATLVAGSLFLLILIVLALYRYFNSPKGIYSALRSVAINNDYAKPSDFSACDYSFVDSCNSDAVNYILVGVKTDLNSSSLYDESVLTAADDLSANYASLPPQKLLNTVNALMKKRDTAMAGKVNDLADIKKLTIKDDLSNFHLSSYRLSGNWAGVILSPNDGNTDSAEFLLEKVSGTWKIKLGPGTGFSDGDFANLTGGTSVGNDESVGTTPTGVPQDISNFFTYGNSDQGEIY